MFPELNTDRFLLRQILPNDKAKIFEGLSHAEVIKYYGVSFKTLDAVQAQMDFYEEILNAGSGIWWAICYKNCPQELIGACGFNDWN
ncbi:MAG: GNAT family N-acetyltransferase, partial [Ferruginibacter sp.]|nr:GNAT family N-acetyltransferase [Ferruginibacter sp.]